MMLKTIRPRGAVALLLIVLSACGGSAEAPRAPSSPPVEGSEPVRAEAATPIPVETTEPSDESTDPPQTASEAAPPSRLAEELEKRREAAKAQTGAEETEAPIPKEEDAPAAPAYTGPDPCRATSFSVERVREACAAGGRASAKRVMKDAVTRAIAMSHSLGCDDCHLNQRDFTLKPNAVADLKRWLESS
jgi:hypothetical protein